MINPLGQNVQIAIEEMKQTSSGLILSTEGLITEKAEVIAIGPEVKKVKKGDKILFKSWALDTVEINKEKISFIKEDDIIALT